MIYDKYNIIMSDSAVRHRVLMTNLPRYYQVYKTSKTKQMKRTEKKTSVNLRGIEC